MTFSSEQKSTWLFSREERRTVIWENKFSLRRNEPLKAGHRLINVEPRKAFTMNELLIWMENSTSGGKESEFLQDKMDVLSLVKIKSRKLQ